MTASQQNEVHVISHTHWDREWYLTFEQYRARLVDLVDLVLDRMASDPAFTFFHLDGQAIVLEDYLEIRPERDAELRRRVAEGRLLAGPWYVMPDMFLVSGEAMVRNLALGIRTAERFGRSMRVGYIPDPFGHIAQMPQILAGFGLEGAILWRGFGGRGAEYIWEAPDGTRTLLMHLPPDGYCNGLRLPLADARDRFHETAAVLNYERTRSKSGQLLLMVGVDHVEPHPALLNLVSMIDAMPGFSARLSTLPAFAAAVATRSPIDALETVHGELRSGQDYAHLLPGVYSARTYLKQANARAERELEQWAEPVSAMAWLSGARLQQGTLHYAWRTLLQNHPHDSICGCSVDAVHDENMTRFAKVLQAAAAAFERAARAIARAVPPAPAGAVRAVAVNTALADWSGVIEGTVEIPLRAVEGFREVDIASVEDPLTFFGDGAHVTSVTDADGHGIPFQVLQEEDAIAFRMNRYAPPVGVHVRRARLALDLPRVASLGYSVIDVHVTRRDTETDLTQRRKGAMREVTEADTRTDARSLENEFLRVQVRDDGAVDVIDKRTGAEYRSVFAIEDSGDVGDEYNYAPPAADQRITNAQARSHAVRRHEPGPLSGSLTIEYALGVPAAAAPDRQSRGTERTDLGVVVDVRLRAGSALVECCVRVNNRAKDHRVRILCPTGASASATHRADTAFGIVERPSSPIVPAGPLVETPVASGPMQSLVDAGDRTIGASVITDGLVEYEVVDSDDRPSIAVTLLRSVGDLSRDDLSTRKGHAGPGLATPGAQCLGTYEFRLAFVPRGAPESDGVLCARARAWLSPPRLVSPAGGKIDDRGLTPAAGAPGSDPSRIAVSASLIGIAADPADGAILSACKVADDRPSIVLRFFNPLDADTRVRIALPPSVAGASLTDLAETRGAPCAVENHEITVTLWPHKIQTIELALGGPDA